MLSWSEFQSAVLILILSFLPSLHLLFVYPLSFSCDRSVESDLSGQGEPCYTAFLNLIKLWKIFVLKVTDAVVDAVRKVYQIRLFVRNGLLVFWISFLMKWIKPSSPFPLNVLSVCQSSSCRIFISTLYYIYSKYLMGNIFKAFHLTRDQSIPCHRC